MPVPLVAKYLSWQYGTAGEAPTEMVGQQMSDHLTDQMPKALGRKHQGDAGDCKSPAYGMPGSIPGRPTN